MTCDSLSRAETPVFAYEFTHFLTQLTALPLPMIREDIFDSGGS